ncbi:sensor histidine kinase [Actinomadura roseirufa]|uniref:sensor histidine kinase n=1 Tax=Actinomadura roseirufa TaxID=2094049 RepID=UPI001F5F230B|nr:sensor histidine kinase [Actinomadura roseirufa]
MRAPEQGHETNGWDTDAPGTTPGRAGARWSPQGRSADALLAAGCLLAVVVSVLVLMRQEDRSHMPLFGWGLVVLSSGVLYFRHRHPIAVAVVTLLACGLYYPLTEPDGPIVITFVVALYTAAAEGHVVIASVLGASALGAITFGESRGRSQHLQDAALYLLAGWFVAVIAIGGFARNRRAYLREAERRALAAERGREEEARRRAIEERLRIARELHDVLGHNISLINVQATAALHGLAREPERAEAALSAIKQASKETLRELRATLGVLRQVDEDGPGGAAPGLGRLAALTGGIAAAGLDVRTEVEGEPRALPAEADLAAYRIVQEALTNVTRHSDAASAVVRIRYCDGHVLVQVDDDGTGVAPASATLGTGSGIRGMRDRAEALGGDLAAGARPGGGFTVRARLPAGH